MRQFVFCHGFGFKATFWNPITPFFQRESCTFLDLGYFGTPHTHVRKHGRPLIGVGHSLGFLKLIKLGLPWDGLISIQGFTCFLGHGASLRSRRARELTRMQERFAIDPTGTLVVFYNRCGIKGPDGRPDNEKLADDMKVLEEDCPLPYGIPVLALGTEDDVIVPPALTHDNFSGHAWISLCALGGHALGHRQMIFVLDHIKAFLARHRI